MCRFFCARAHTFFWAGLVVNDVSFPHILLFWAGFVLFWAGLVLFWAGLVLFWAGLVNLMSFYL